MSNTIKLRTDSILQIPIRNYQNDFTFIVNGEKFEMNRFVADLISTRVSTIHQFDQSQNEYSITTISKGNFAKFFDLLTFSDQSINDNEIPFFSEIIEKLGTEKIQINISTTEITLENVFDLLSKHEKFSIFYSKQISEEIEFISKHFSELDEAQTEKICNFSYDTIERIINNDKLELSSEDQLISFINKLYSISNQYSNLYSYVCFENVSKKIIEEFINKFNIDDLTQNTWKSLSKRLIENSMINEKSLRYKKIKIFKEIPYLNNNLKGIFNFFKANSNINDEIKITFSSHQHGEADLLLDIENQSNDFYTNNEPNSWICFEFKKHLIIPTYYTIKSCKDSPNGIHPKNWVIEGLKSNDEKWKIIDEQKNCSFLNGSYLVHTFPIHEQKDKFKFIRLKQTGLSWRNDNYLDICSIEFYGQII